MSQCSEDNSDCHNNSSALELAGECFIRVFTGDWSQINEDLLILSMILMTFVFSWYFVFCTLRIPSLWRRARAGMRARNYAALANTATQLVGENLHNQRTELADPVETVPEESRQNADLGDAGDGSDLRAAGDGWEDNTDPDYVVDEDVLLQGAAGFSDEDSDDDTVVLRQTTMATDADVTEAAPQDEPQIVEIPEVGGTSVTVENVTENVVEAIADNVAQHTSEDGEQEAARSTEGAAGEDAQQTPTNESTDASPQQD